MSEAARSGGGEADRSQDGAAAADACSTSAAPSRLALGDREALSPSGGLDHSLFRYIWRHSKRDQILICLVVLASQPLYFASLDLPRKIVNEAIQGRAFAHGELSASFLRLHLQLPQWAGGEKILFPGFDVDRFGLLFGLSCLFLLLVLINGAFKYWINVAKGALGERMLRRLRFQLFALILRFSPAAIRQTKSSELATIIRDEVEPVGGFIGDAFILPVFLGLQALTALAFIMIQNWLLGLMAAAVVAVQFVVIPRMRRELLRLGRLRQLASRRLAGRVGEVVDGIEAVHVSGSQPWERAEIGQRLFELFDLRLSIYRRKFMVKFLNNLLAQMTPFLFYAIGGYFALKGRLDIGQLVAVIAAYRDLPPPLKELIDWDQQRLDVQVKYEQVVQQFWPERLPPLVQAGEDAPLEGTLAVEDLDVAIAQDPIVEGVSLSLTLPDRIALISDGGAAASTFARTLAGALPPSGGRIRIGERDLGAWPADARARRIAFVGSEPVLFPGSLRENIVYGLRSGPQAVEAPRENANGLRRVGEALRTGNPTADPHADWTDYARADVDGPDALDAWILTLLETAGMGADIYRFGLLGLVDPERHPQLAERLIEARGRLRERLEADGMADLVAPFDAERYNRQATVAENLLFGVPTERVLIGRALAEHRVFRATLRAEGLEDDLVAMGESIASTMLEIFRGLPPGHPLFEQFSFLSADELPEYEAVLARRTVGTVRTPRDAAAGEVGDDGWSLLRRTLSRFAARRLGVAGRYGPADRTSLVALPLAYIEPRHRLGLLEPALEARLVTARAALRAALDEAGEAGVAYYDPDAVCPAAPLRDNLLFGRADQSVADAGTRVTAAITALIEEMDLSEAIARVGLDHQVGPGGRLLTSAQRGVVSLARALVRRPDWLVLDGALTPLGEARGRQVLELMLARFKEQSRTLVVVLPSARIAGDFGIRITASGTHLALEEGPVAQQPTATPASTEAQANPTHDRASKPAAGEEPSEDIGGPPPRSGDLPPTPEPNRTRRVPQEASR